MSKIVKQADGSVLYLCRCGNLWDGNAQCFPCPAEEEDWDADDNWGGEPDRHDDLAGSQFNMDEDVEDNYGEEEEEEETPASKRQKKEIAAPKGEEAPVPPLKRQNALRRKNACAAIDEALMTLGRTEALGVLIEFIGKYK